MTSQMHSLISKFFALAIVVLLGAFVSGNAAAQTVQTSHHQACHDADLTAPIAVREFTGTPSAGDCRAAESGDESICMMLDPSDRPGQGPGIYSVIVGGACAEAQTCGSNFYQLQGDAADYSLASFPPGICVTPIQCSRGWLELPEVTDGLLRGVPDVVSNNRICRGPEMNEATALHHQRCYNADFRMPIAVRAFSSETPGSGDCRSARSGDELACQQIIPRGFTSSNNRRNEAFAGVVRGACSYETGCTGGNPYIALPEIFGAMESGGERGLAGSCLSETECEAFTNGEAITDGSSNGGRECVSSILPRSSHHQACYDANFRMPIAVRAFSGTPGSGDCRPAESTDVSVCENITPTAGTFNAVSEGICTRDTDCPGLGFGNNVLPEVLTHGQRAAAGNCTSDDNCSFAYKGIPDDGECRLPRNDEECQQATLRNFPYHPIYDLNEPDRCIERTEIVAAPCSAGPNIGEDPHNSRAALTPDEFLVSTPAHSECGVGIGGSPPPVCESRSGGEAGEIAYTYEGRPFCGPMSQCLAIGGTLSDGTVCLNHQACYDADFRAPIATRPFAGTPGQGDCRAAEDNDADREVCETIDPDSRALGPGRYAGVLGSACAVVPTACAGNGGRYHPDLFFDRSAGNDGVGIHLIGDCTTEMTCETGLRDNGVLPGILENDICRAFMESDCEPYGEFTAEGRGGTCAPRAPGDCPDNREFMAAPDPADGGTCTVCMNGEVSTGGASCACPANEVSTGGAACACQTPYFEAPTECRLPASHAECWLVRNDPNPLNHNFGRNNPYLDAGTCRPAETHQECAEVAASVAAAYPTRAAEVGGLRIAAGSNHQCVHPGTSEQCRDANANLPLIASHAIINLLGNSQNSLAQSSIVQRNWGFPELSIEQCIPGTDARCAAAFPTESLIGDDDGSCRAPQNGRECRRLITDLTLEAPEPEDPTAVYDDGACAEECSAGEIAPETQDFVCRERTLDDCADGQYLDEADNRTCKDPENEAQCRLARKNVSGNEMDQFVNGACGTLASCTPPLMPNVQNVCHCPPETHFGDTASCVPHARCGTNYDRNADDNMCECNPPNVEVGNECQTPADCAEPLTANDQNVCHCPPDTHFGDTASCVPHTDCTGEGANVIRNSDDNTCVCADNFEGEAGSCTACVGEYRSENGADCACPPAESFDAGEGVCEASLEGMCADPFDNYNSQTNECNCPAGQRPNADETACEAPPCLDSHKRSEETGLCEPKTVADCADNEAFTAVENGQGGTCAVCGDGERVNADQTACEAIPAASGGGGSSSSGGGAAAALIAVPVVLIGGYWLLGGFDYIDPTYNFSYSGENRDFSYQGDAGFSLNHGSLSSYARAIQSNGDAVAYQSGISYGKDLYSLDYAAYESKSIYDYDLSASLNYGSGLWSISPTADAEFNYSTHTEDWTSTAGAGLTAAWTSHKWNVRAHSALAGDLNHGLDVEYKF